MLIRFNGSQLTTETLSVRMLALSVTWQTTPWAWHTERVERMPIELKESLTFWRPLAQADEQTSHSTANRTVRMKSCQETNIFILPSNQMYSCVM